MKIAPGKKTIFMLAYFVGILLFGTAGYHFIEGSDFFTSFYMTVITISTVGFGEIVKLSNAGRIFTIFIILNGISFVAYTFGTIIGFVIEGELRKTFVRRKMEKLIHDMSDHFIICGYGRIGRLVARDLKESGYKSVIIENNSELIESLENDSMVYLNMDATVDEVLLKAGIMRARAVITAVKSDSDNVFIVLTARSLNQDIFILSRASDEKVEGKLTKAGANKVVLPYLIGGKRIVHSLIRPTVVDFVDTTMIESDLGIEMGEFFIKPNSQLVGKSLLESNIRNNYGVIIVAIKKYNGGMLFNPTAKESFNASDVLVVLGKKKDLVEMKKSL